MSCLKNGLWKGLLLIIVMSSLVSCGVANHFKSPAGNVEGNNSDQMKISALTSELSEIKQDQANLILQMEHKDTTIQKLQDTILDLEKKIAFLENKAVSASPVQYKIEYTNPTILYKKARNLLIEDNYVNAAALFTEFIKLHPQNSLADNSVYWLAECYYSLGKYKKAISIFKDLITNYPKSEKVPDAMLKIGYSYLSLDDSNRAHHYLKQVLQKYPFTPAAEKAQKKLGDFE